MMKEDFLQYVWKFKKFNFSDLVTTAGETLVILNSGEDHSGSGPDFFNAQITIDDQIWAGNIEIHLKSSDWYVHAHETDVAYENVILHVVWEHDTEVYRKDNSEIPVLEIKKYIAPNVIMRYKTLTAGKSWIYCEKQLESIPQFTLMHWQERLFFERLERKSISITALAERSGNDWEAVLFWTLAKNFGLNTNGDLFLKIARSIPFTIIRKEAFEYENLEALLLGRAGLLAGEKEDQYYKSLQNRWMYLSVKYQLAHVHIDPVAFFRHRPDNFPTIRLSQLAQLYHRHHNLFSKLICCDTVAQIKAVLEVTVSPYWKTHYQFDRLSPPKKKVLSDAFMELIIINTIVPLQFTYALQNGRDCTEQSIRLLSSMPPEKNAVLDKFLEFKIKAKSAYESQALLQLKKEYCERKRCLECAIGMELLKG